ncbi:MAG: ABC transporter ATP-binding protein [Fluviicoccus sp.]|uniref:ABC transporter ATP-binding protein n=1 Tax=Fluviicoccus sp. TaxID=2003552 RepID=UPI002726275D|nr:ABC transporter ATP-binding protein [Fluviicoccus sp.]MDO8329670.1 ABC transporter ATP-binding protein [Fluviicoccus sp.]
MNTAPENALVVRHLSKSVTGPDGSLTILQQMDFTVRTGESIAIVGASGSGKSTLLGLLAGLDTPTDGSVTLLGHDLSLLDEDGRAEVRQRHVGFVFQSFHLLPHLSALENVLLPLSLAGREDRALAIDCLQRVGLGERLQHTPRQLSGGEQQRVAIARAFACRPQILFADEPTGNLDARTGQQIIELLFAMNREQGATLVLVTHDPALAQRCGRSLRLDSGCLLEPEA